MVAVSTLNTIGSFILNALPDDFISDEEYSLIVLEFETFPRMKEDLREKSKMTFEETGNIETDVNELLRRNKNEFMFKTTFKIMFETMFKTIFKTMFKTNVGNHVYNRIRKKLNIANKGKSFLKITHPKKRDFIVNEFLKTRQNIQQNLLSERVGDLSTQCELS